MKRSSGILRSATCLALMSVTAARGVNGQPTEREVTFNTADGWQIVGWLHLPKKKVKTPAVLLLHGSRHESDAYGNVTSQGLPQALAERGIAVLRIDIRGRGASREPQEYHSFAPEQREAVSLDVEAAIKFLASQSGVDAKRLGVVAEQDSANAALEVVATDRRITSYTLISGRVGQAAKQALAGSAKPVFCIASKEDKRGFKDMMDVYLSSKSRQSRLKVFEGMPLGTTMFTAWRFDFPHEQPIEDMLAGWLADRLNETADSTRRR